ncbi:MAG TPA: hypothetical protein VLX90_12545 [Steroidobacteraceae bacterium]|nr:hypothetical protein [Steroidobacteraceae bacterium]
MPTPTTPAEQPPSETALLLANIDAALRDLANSRGSGHVTDRAYGLDLALQTYGSIKHLLPKLTIEAAQRRLVEAHLALLRAEIISANQAIL